MKLFEVALWIGLTGNVCLAFLFYPVTRGSSVLPLLGLTSEGSIKYHIWLGHMTMVLFTIHGICYIIDWAVTGNISEVINVLYYIITRLNLKGNISPLSFFFIFFWSSFFSLVLRLHVSIWKAGFKNLCYENDVKETTIKDKTRVFSSINSSPLILYENHCHETVHTTYRRTIKYGCLYQRNLWDCRVSNKRRSSILFSSFGCGISPTFFFNLFWFFPFFYSNDTSFSCTNKIGFNINMISTEQDLRVFY